MCHVIVNQTQQLPSLVFVEIFERGLRCFRSSNRVFLETIKRN